MSAIFALGRDTTGFIQFEYDLSGKWLELRGNPVTEMMGDANVAAAQIDFFAGLVTEMTAVPPSNESNHSPIIQPRMQRGAPERWRTKGPQVIICASCEEWHS